MFRNPFLLLSLSMLILLCSGDDKTTVRNTGINFDPFQLMMDSLAIMGFAIDSIYGGLVLGTTKEESDSNATLSELEKQTGEYDVEARVLKTLGVIDSTLKSDTPALTRVRKANVKGLYKSFPNRAIHPFNYEYAIVERIFRDSISAHNLYRKYQKFTPLKPSRAFDTTASALKYSATEYGISFVIENRAYYITTRLFYGSHIYFFVNIFKDIFSQNTPETIYAKMRNVKDRITTLIITNNIINQLGTENVLKMHKLLLYPQDTLSSNDSINLYRGISKYRKLHGMDTLIAIDSLLLKKMSITIF